MSAGRPTWITLDLDAVVANYRLAAACGVPPWPVLKADGYGLGAVAVAGALVRAGAAGFCVALVKEAEALRRAGIDRPIVLLSGFGPGQEEQVASLGLQSFLYQPEVAKALSAAADPARPVPLHLKVDTGMGRLGLSPEEAPEVVRWLGTLPGVRLVGLVSHLACADERDNPATAAQLARFRELLAHPAIAPLGLRRSLANSAGLLGHPETHLDWTRPGIMLYGASPFWPHSNARQEGITPVVGWHSRIIQIRELPAGIPIGYGHTWRTPRPSRIAQLPVGYGDGYSRAMGNRGHVLIAGQLAPVVGRVCMDLTAVDVTAIPAARVGSVATLLGRDGAREITTETLAGWEETIPYEVTCRLGRRLTVRHAGEATTPA